VGGCDRAAHEGCMFWVKNPKTSGRGSVFANDVQGLLDSGSGELIGVG
jgi:hypothetical protein